MDLRKTFENIKFQADKHSPEILLVSGLVAAGGAVVASYFARPKVDEALRKFEEADNRVLEAIELLKEGKITEEEALAIPAPDKKKLVIDTAKAMALPIGLAVLSAGCLISSYRIQHMRLVGLSGAYAVLSNEFKDFKDKLAKEIGPEKVRDLIRPTRDIEKVTLDKKGNEVKEVEKIQGITNLQDGIWFSESDEYASDNHEYNLMFVESVISKLDLIAFSKGSLTVNDVLEEFGIDKRKHGAILGWPGSSNVRIDYEVSNIYNEKTQMREPQIYIHWEQPQWLYR